MVLSNMNTKITATGLILLFMCGCAQTQKRYVLHETLPISKEQISAMEEVVEVQPANILALKKLVSAYITNHEFERARHYADRLLTLDSSDVDAHYFMGLIYARQGFEAEAKEAFNKALELNPRHIPSLFAKAYIEEKKMNFYGARKLYYEVLEIDPDDADAHYNLAVLYDKKLFYPKKAFYHYEKALNLYKQQNANPDLIFLLKDRIDELKLLARDE